ncbi:zinc finger, CCHC-type containing protein [Tanacetum coccineum]
MDVKTAFLNGELEKEVYMNQLLGFILPGNENKVCKLVNKFDASGKGFIICLYVDDMLIFGSDQVQVDLTKEFLSSRFFVKDMGEADVILVSIPLDTCKKLMPNRDLAVSQLEYFRVIGCLMYVMTYTRLYIAFVVGKLSRYTSNPGTQHWQAIMRISNTEDNSSTSGWVFLLGGGVISWASKKQTYTTGSTMESEFFALATAGKEAKWLKNLLLEIPLWVKPIAPISIYYDSAATLAKAYSQMYSGKSRHLGVRHSMIHELITNGVVSIKFVRSQQNLADHLTKGLARDLVIKSAEGMGLKMCLEPADMEDEVDNFSMVNFFEKVLSKSMNKEESPMYGVYTKRSLNTLTLIVVKGIHGSDELGNSLSKLKDTIWSNPLEEVSSKG